MTIKDLPEALQSSALAPMLLNLDDPKIEEKEEAQAVVEQLTLTPLLADDDHTPHLVLVETEQDVSFRIPSITASKDDVQCIGRVGHLNYMLKIGRMYWDPEDGEIGIDWVVRKTSEDVLTPEAAEYIIACLMQVYAAESLYFLAAKLKSSGIPTAAVKPLLEAAQKELKETFAPVLDAVMSE